MKVLFDQCTPKALREALPEHDVQTAHQAGMADLENGKLIEEAVKRGYDLLVTADRRMQKQQEIDGKPLRVVVLTRPEWDKAKSQIKEIRQAIATAETGQFTRVIAPRTQPQAQLSFKERDDGLFHITGLSRAVLNLASGSSLLSPTSRPCYATSATRLSGGASASKAPTR